ncbi:expressed unknown protein [Seminavis robusta]|uniref:Uncharacterized protein n=1 Tax=Seminavis robusta TaxID=568900 RepID=A0A9N8H654_9STRA|nr:expressed unknown protein [Seminavis robusta]|eukprot:Sro103_g052410.1 n/a (316) ;mRNA; r:35589-36536
MIPSLPLLLACLLLCQATLGDDRDDIGRFIPDQPCVCKTDVVDCTNPEDCTCLVQNEILSSCRCGLTAAATFRSYLCPTTECCAGHGTRRRDRQLMGADLAMDPDDPVHQELYKTYLERCGQYEYQTYLYVTHHMYAVASPPDEAFTGDEACPFLVTHAHFDSRDSPATKMLLFWETKEEGEARFANGLWKDKSIQVGSFPLSELARAYEAVDLESDGPFDVVTNNCGNYIIRLALQLGIKIDPRIMSFVTQRLMEESSARFMKDLKGRMGSIWTVIYEWIQYYLGFLWGAPSSDSKGALLEQLVSQQAASFQQE